MFRIDGQRIDCRVVRDNHVGRTRDGERGCRRAPAAGAMRVQQNVFVQCDVSGRSRIRRVDRHAADIRPPRGTAAVAEFAQRYRAARRACAVRGGDRQIPRTAGIAYRLRGAAVVNAAVGVDRTIRRQLDDAAELHLAVQRRQAVRRREDIAKQRDHPAVGSHLDTAQLRSTEDTGADQRQTHVSVTGAVRVDRDLLVARGRAVQSRPQAVDGVGEVHVTAGPSIRRVDVHGDARGNYPRGGFREVYGPGVRVDRGRHIGIPTAREYEPTGRRRSTSVYGAPAKSRRRPHIAKTHVAGRIRLAHARRINRQATVPVDRCLFEVDLPRVAARCVGRVRADRQRAAIGHSHVPNDRHAQGRLGGSDSIDLDHGIRVCKTQRPVGARSAAHVHCQRVQMTSAVHRHCCQVLHIPAARCAAVTGVDRQFAPGRVGRNDRAAKTDAAARRADRVAAQVRPKRVRDDHVPAANERERRWSRSSVIR